jgi:Raf kinase inhibitor-like YbhB/YbcL family protein
VFVSNAGGWNTDNVKILSSFFYFVLCANLAASGEFRLTSTMWHQGGSVPLESVYNGSGCHGANLSPEMEWSGAPSNARSFALTIFDLDASKPGGWSHWIIFNIPGNVLKLAKGAGTEGSQQPPAGALQCINDYGTRGYGGPCPPPGATHRYVANIYALKVDKLPSNLELSPAKAVKQIEANSIAVARMTVKYRQ